MTTARMEALSDGVFAVAITLLSLDLPIPAPGTGGLAHIVSAVSSRYALPVAAGDVSP